MGLVRRLVVECLGGRARARSRFAADVVVRDVCATAGPALAAHLAARRSGAHQEEEDSELHERGEENNESKQA